jgi:hypothetical protein
MCNWRANYHETYKRFVSNEVQRMQMYLSRKKWGISRTIHQLSSLFTHDFNPSQRLVALQPDIRTVFCPATQAATNRNFIGY